MAGLIICLLAISAAAYFKAVADTLKHHFHTSIFKDKDQAFWNPDVSWQQPRIKFTKYPLDAWHIANSCMIVSFAIAIICDYFSTFPWWAELIIAGILFNLVFNTFYNKILLKK